MTHRRTLLSLAVALAVWSPALADEPELEEIRARLAALAQRELDKGTASISLALVKDGEVVLTEAWGLANVWAKTPATPESIYCTGSTFKAVTATAILQLAEQGELSLDDPANDHLGEHPLVADEDDRVTVRMLLNHTSGLEPGASTEDVWTRELPTRLEDIPGGLSLQKEPGKTYQYNNHAYAVAGLLVEEVSGQSYEDYIVEHILQPLGVTTPRPIHPTPAMVERMALPYVPGPDEKPSPASFVHFDVYPAGDVYLTAEDMARFLAAHLGGGVFQGTRLLEEQSLEEAHRAGRGDYGLGWAVAKKDGRTFISHGGGVPGFRTHMSGDVETNVGAYVMSNSGDMTRLAAAALQMLSGEEFELPEARAAIELPVAVLEEYVGVYAIAGRELSVELADGKLSAQLTGQGPLALYAEAPDRLFFRSVEANLEIERDAEGKVTGLILHQGGQATRGTRAR